MAMSGRDGARRGEHRITLKNRWDLTRDYVTKTSGWLRTQSQKAHTVTCSFSITHQCTLCRHTLNLTSQLTLVTLFMHDPSRSKVVSLEITPCSAASVSVPAVLVVCPTAGVCFWCSNGSNTWTGVLGITRVNKKACEQCCLPHAP